MVERASGFARVHVDFGTGDGTFVLRRARQHPDVLYVGVDAASEGLRASAHRAARKPARGGLDNVLFGRLALHDAPGELEGLTDALTVLLPWGSLLRAVARPEFASLGRLRALCKPGAELQVVFGYGSADRDAAALELPLLAEPGALAALEGGFAEAGFSVRARRVPLQTLKALPTTWSGKLAFSGNERTFVEVRGHTLG